MKRILTAGALCFVISLCLAGCGEKGVEIPVEQVETPSLSESGTPAQETQEPPKEEKQPENVCVYVCGAVNHPGVYELPSGARIVQAIDAAGGMLENADAQYLNQAQILEDGQQVTVLTKEETADLPAGTNEPGSTAGTGDRASKSAEAGDGTGDGRVNINTADAAALQTLTGIGEVRAQAILEYRQANGPFGSIEDLKKVDGIKDGVFQKIKDEIVAE